MARRPYSGITNPLYPIHESGAGNISPYFFSVAMSVLLFIFRQIKSILIPLIAISTTLIWVAGIMAHFEISINVESYLTFNLLMIIGASNAIHLLMNYHEWLSLVLSQRDSLD